MEGLSGKPSLSGEPFALDLFSSLSSYHLLFAVIFSLFWCWWGFSSDQRKIDLRCLWECGRSQHLQLFHSHLHNREKWWWQYIYYDEVYVCLSHRIVAILSGASFHLFVMLFPHCFLTLSIYVLWWSVYPSVCHSWGRKWVNKISTKARRSTQE